LNPIWFFFGFIILIVALGVLMHVLGERHERKRTEALARRAHERRETFHPEKNPALPNRFAHFEIFSRGFDRYGHNATDFHLKINHLQVAGLCGDLHYKQREGSGKNRRTVTYRRSFIVLEPPYAIPHTLNCRREGLLDKLAGAFGYDDIDFESAEFSQRFHIKSSEKRFAYDLFDPRMIQFMMSEPPPELTIAGGQLLLLSGTIRWKPEEFDAMIDWAARFFAQWPQHLVRQLQATTPTREPGTGLAGLRGSLMPNQPLNIHNPPPLPD
jgi:hypothetical protein